jgi:hypothetical protein
MKANELFEVSKSLKKKGKGYGRRGFTGRVYGVLKRAGFLSLDDDQLVKRLNNLVLSGEIWGIHMLGEKGILEICEWLESKESQE